MSMTEVEQSSQVGRGLLSTMRSLLVLGQLMIESSGEQQILDLAVTAVPSLGSCWVVGMESSDAFQQSLDSSPTTRGPMGCAVTVPGAGWGWAFPLGSHSGRFGAMVLAAEMEPSEEEQFLLRALAQQTGAALANQQLHAQELAAADELSEVNSRLRGSLTALERSIEIHDRLTAVAASGEGRDGIARAVHELTGLPVAIEDRHGNLQAWAGSNRPDPYPKAPVASREKLLRKVRAANRPIREGGNLIALAHPQGDIVGVISLVDPGCTASEHDVMALEHGATILAMELARVRSVAESELRIRRDLVDELLNGTEEESALARATALDYDLQSPHRVVLIEAGRPTEESDALFQAVRSAARHHATGTLLIARGTQVVLLANGETNWEAFRQSVMRSLGASARVALGDECRDIADFPRSFHQARLVIQLMRSAELADQSVRFEDLGLYRLLIGNEDFAEVERFIHQWIGTLLEYDTNRKADLVRTLTHYLNHGGNYASTAESLIVHRNTLKYRLQRIRQVTSLDLSDPEVCFNLKLATRAWQTLTALRSVGPA